MKSLLVHGVCVLLCSILSLTCWGLCNQCSDIEIAGVPSGLPSCSASGDTVDGKYYVYYDTDTHKAILLSARTTTSTVVVPSTVEVNVSWDCIEQFRVVGVVCRFNGAISVEFPDGVLVDNGLFSNSKTIESVILPSDLRRIPDALFKSCPNLRSVTGPTAVESVGEDAFNGCTSLKVIPETGLIRNVENSGFQGCRSLGAFSSSELRTIGDSAFRGCSSLISVLISEGLVTIGSMAFYGADSLESVGLPVGIREIGEKAFAYSGVTHATLPVDLSEEIGGISMFAGCENLVDVNLPKGLQYIPEEMFAFCSSLTNVDIPASVERIGAGAFMWTGLKTVILPEGLKKIEAETFKVCESLESISWPSELSEIGRLAFFRTCITNADFTGTKLAVVGDRAFDSCGALTNGVFFPRTLHTLGSQSLSGIGYALIGWYYENMPYDKMDSYPRLTVSFLGPPPDAGDDLLAYESEWNVTYLGNNCIYKYMTYEPEFQEAWEESIASYQASHIEKTWDWHNLTVKKIIVVEPTDWKLEKGGRQTLTISWHFPTNATYTIDQATTDLKALGKRYKIYRGKDDKKYWDDFSKKECIVESTSDLSYSDKSFGDIKGTHPVRYWVEVIGEGAMNTPEPVHCDTRRRFGLAVGVSTYGEGMKETPVGGFVADTRKFVSMLESSYDGCKIDEILDLHATVENISQRIRALPFEDKGKKRIVPGDMVFLWIATHGGEDGSIAAYNGYYGNSVSSVYNAHDTAMNVTSCLRSDLSWVGGEPGVRVVCLFPFCHSRAVWQGFDSFLNCAFIGATRKIDVSVLDNLKTQFGTYFLGYGVAKGLANLSGISGSPYADLGEDGFDVPPYVCNSQSGNTVTLDELGRYAKSLAFGASWKKRARAVVERPELLSTIIMAEGCMAVKGNVPGLPELSPHETDSGIINLHYKLPKGCTSAIFWFREKRESAEWHWFTLDFAASDARRFGRDVGVLEWIWEVTVNDRKPFVPFGTQTQEERTYRGVVRPDTEYEFALQGVNEFGYGVTRHIRVPYRTGADLPMVAREVFVREFREMRNYLGRLNKKGINASVCITPDGDFWTICLSLDENGSPVEYIGRASRNDISDNGVMKVNVSCKTKALKFSANSASEEIALPNSFDLNVSIDCVEGANSDFGLSCIPVAEVGFDEYAACPGVQFQVDPPVSSLLGEVSYSAKSLPKGLSIDSSSGVISGIPTVPGAYVVLVTVKSKTDPTQTETIEVPIVIGNYVDETIVVDDEYGPYVPGEMVGEKFPEGAAWKVTGLPTGLKWDAKLPGVTGVPTKPGTNTVYFTWTDKTVTPNVTHTASSTFIVGPLPVLSVQTAGEGTGKVTGAGAYAANKKLTLKATADTKDAAAKGKNPATVKSVFAGWYDATGGLVAQTPSLSYVMPPHDVALQARFIPASNDWATADCVTEAGSVLVVSNETNVVLAPISVVAAGGSLPTVKVAGLPSGLKFTAKDIMKKNPKTEVDVPANTIYGTPTKGGVYNATVTVTTAGKASVVRVIKFIIRTASDYVVDVDWDPMQGKVTGAGVYQADKKVTLKATANRGYVFAGWYEGGDGALGERALPLTQAASYVIDKMPTNSLSYFAQFVTTDEDEASISADVNGFAFGAGTAGPGGAVVTQFATNVMTGVYFEWPVAASALSETTVKVAGLPSGLKFTAKPVTTRVPSGTGAARVTTVVTNVPANTIYGAPTAASKTAKATDGTLTVKPSEVKVTVTTAGKSKADYVVSLTVDPIPAFAVGTFDGWHGDGVDALGSATLTVAANGKVTGKVLMPVEGKGKTYNFKADSLSGFSRAGDGSVTNVTVAATLTGENRAAVPLALVFAPDEIGIGGVEGAFDEPWSGWLWLGQNGWQRGDYDFPNIQKNLVKTLDDGLTLTFKKNGVVTVGGKIVGDDGVKLVSANGSSQLVSDSESADGFILLVYVPPAKNLASGLRRLYDVKLIDAAGDNIVTDVELIERLPNSGE